MGYFTLNKITPPNPPNDNNVDEQYALSANWDTLDTKMGNVSGIGIVTGLEVGQEVVQSGRFTVQTATGLKNITPYETAWSAWTPLPLIGGSNFIARSGFPPEYRINTLLRQGELTGGILFDAAASAWTHNSVNIVSSSTPGALTSYTPVASSIQVISTSAITSTSDIQGARAILDNINGWRLRIHFFGTSGGGNFVMLDRCRWWY
jgi:hypothetical protein